MVILSAEGFEPSISASQEPRNTKLSHALISIGVNVEN